MAGLSLSLLLVAGLLTWVLLDDQPYVAPPPDQPARTVSPDGASAAMRHLVRAVATGDTDAAEAVAPPDDPEAAARLGSLVDNARDLRVGEFSLRYVTELGGVDAEGRWSASVDATWAFRGFDETPARAEIRVGFATLGGKTYVTGLGGGDRRSPVWMTGPVEVRRTPRTLVVVRGGPAEADDYAARARAAVPVVRAVLPRWSGGLVVEVPASPAALHRALDSDPGTYDDIAAVTTSADGLLTPDAPVHVFVNPQLFAGLRPRGAQVVISHEAVHVATGAAAGSPLPLWLLEGFADYVALRDVPLPLRVTAAQIIERVRKDGAPASLPGPEDFGTRTPYLGASYEAAWLACRLVAQRAGEEALVRVYRRVDAGVPLRRALPRETGFTLPALTRAWRDLLTDLAA